MKKLQLNLQQIEGAEVLTRAQLKRVLGLGINLNVTNPGDQCSMTYYSNEGWQTVKGRCKVRVSDAKTNLNPYRHFYEPYCEAGSFQSPTPLSSNGGESRCGPSFYA